MVIKAVVKVVAVPQWNNMSDDNLEINMDPRCPRMLESHPDSFCPLAVLRLKRLRQAGRELTEEEESRLPGCCWAVNHQMSCYCFFKYAHDYLDPTNPPSDVEIAHMNSLSTETIKKTTKDSLEKFKSSDMIQQLEEHFDDEEIVNPQDEDPEYEIKYR